MPRRPRLIVPEVPLHIIQRGNNRTTTFHTARDFARYLDVLHDTSTRYECAIHAYVLMFNHVHLLISAADQSGPSRMMQTIGRRYVPYVNGRYDRTGTLWEGRYRSCPIDTVRYLLTCSRYIELNPVRAMLADDPSRYRWSSYRTNACGVADRLITPHAEYQALGSTPEERQAAYRALFDEALMPDTIDTIRRATNANGLVGDDCFRRLVEEKLQRSLTRRRHGGDRRSATFRLKDQATLTP